MIMPVAWSKGSAVIAPDEKQALEDWISGIETNPCFPILTNSSCHNQKVVLYSGEPEVEDESGFPVTTTA